MRLKSRPASPSLLVSQAVISQSTSQLNNYVRCNESLGKMGCPAQPAYVYKMAKRLDLTIVFSFSRLAFVCARIFVCGRGAAIDRIIAISY